MSRGLPARAFVEQRSAKLADLANRLHFTERVGHPLRDPPLNPEAFSKLPRVKWLRQCGWQQPAQVGRCAELMRFVNRHEMLIFHQVVIISSPPPPTVARVAPLLDFDE